MCLYFMEVIALELQNPSFNRVFRRLGIYKTATDGSLFIAYNRSKIHVDEIVHMHVRMSELLCPFVKNYI